MSPPGDPIRVSVLVAADRELAFRVFTEEIDLWWRRGPRFRAAGRRSGLIALEPGVGGRLFESFETEDGPKVVESGRVTVWEPPARLAFTWRATNFDPGESTEIEVLFEPRPIGTLVTIVHGGWSSIRDDHPVRHGLAGAAFQRWMGLWWGDLATSLRERTAVRACGA